LEIIASAPRAYATRIGTCATRSVSVNENLGNEAADRLVRREARGGRRNLVAAHLPIVGLVHARRHGVGAEQARQQAKRDDISTL
jgi:hypothetical protein